MNLAELGISMSPNMVAGDSINYSISHEHLQLIQPLAANGMADFEQRLRSETHHVVAGDRTIWLALRAVDEDVMRRASVLSFDCTHVTSSATPQWAQGGFVSGTFTSGATTTLRWDTGTFQGFPAAPPPPKRPTGPDLARSFRRRLHLT